MGWYFRGQAVEVREGEDRSVKTFTNDISTANAGFLVPDSIVEESGRPPYDGEYIGTIEVVILRCHASDKLPIIANDTPSDESSDDNELSMPGQFVGASESRTESKSKSTRRAQTFGVDGGWENWGPPPPPLDEPKRGKIEMTSENTVTWNPVGQQPKSSDALERNKPWDKRSGSRDHFQSDFTKNGSRPGSQRGRFEQPRSITDQENAGPIHLRGGGPGSYTITSSEAMRNWNGGPPAAKEWTQEDVPFEENEGVPATFDPWTANLPTGDLTHDGETKTRTHVGGWGIEHETKNKPGGKKGGMKDSIVSDADHVQGPWRGSDDQDQGKNDQWGGKTDLNQGNNGDDWGTSGVGGNHWGGAGNSESHNDGEWGTAGDQSRVKNNEWNNNGGESSWDAPNNDGKKDDGVSGSPNNASNENKDGWGANENNNTEQNGEWGETTGNDTQQDNGWGDNSVQQTNTWGGDDTKQATTGAKDSEKKDRATSHRQATVGDKAGSTWSFGNSRAKDPKPTPKARSKIQMATDKETLTFDWQKPSLEKPSNASGPPVILKKPAKKSSVPRTWDSPVAPPKLGKPEPLVSQTPPSFSISSQPKPKPYWSNWRNPNAAVEAETEDEQAPSPEEPGEPLYCIPAEVAQRNMMSHQVRPGRPAAYTHKSNKPKYMDTHESPYAVFVFKYRDKEILEHMLETNITEPETDEKARLVSLSKHELIDELIKTKSKLSVVESDSSGQATFVKKLDEKLSKLETSKEDVPAINDWVKSTSPTNGPGMAGAGKWGGSDTQKGKRGGRSGKGNERSDTSGRNWSGDKAKNPTANGNAGDSWGVNEDDDTKGKGQWDNNGYGEASNGAGESGNGGNDWGNTDQKNDGNGKDENSWGANAGAWGGDWSKNDTNNSGEAKPTDDWVNNQGDNKAADDWGNDKGGDSGGDGGWGGNDDKKDEGHDGGNAGGDNSWGANNGDEGGGGGGGW